MFESSTRAGSRVFLSCALGQHLGQGNEFATEQRVERIDRRILDLGAHLVALTCPLMVRAYSHQATAPASQAELLGER